MYVCHLVAKEERELRKETYRGLLAAIKDRSLHVVDGLEHGARSDWMLRGRVRGDLGSVSRVPVHVVMLLLAQAVPALGPELPDLPAADVRLSGSSKKSSGGGDLRA